MRLNALRLQNFRQHADTSIAFDLGLTGIIGPNGAGKSTILEAIAWALYGSDAARGGRDTIRFLRAGARATVRVDLDFELDRHRYRVERGLTTAELYLDGAEAPIANSITAVNDTLRKKLGMSREEFFNTYFTGQKELSVMAAMGAPQRAQFLSRVLGYEKLKQAQDLVREQLRSVGSEIAGLRAGMPDAEVVARMRADAERRIAEADAQVAHVEAIAAGAAAARDNVAPLWLVAQSERERWQELAAELRVAESEAAAYDRDADRVSRELADLSASRAELEQIAEALRPFAEIASEFQRLEALAREEGRRQTLNDSVAALDAEAARLDDRRGRIERAPETEEQLTEALEKQRQALETTEGQLEARRTEWVRDRQEAETKLQALRAQYAELKDQRDRLIAAGEEGVCPTCTRPLGGHFRSVLDLLDAQLETVRVDGNYFKSRLEQLDEMPEDIKLLDERRRTAFAEVGVLERKLAKCQTAVQELATIAREIALKAQRRVQLERDLSAIPPGYNAARHAEVRHEVTRLAPLDARAARLSAQVEREPQLARERARVEEARGSARARVADLEARRAGIRFSEVEYAATRQAAERADAEVRAAEMAVVGARSEAQSARAMREMALKSQIDLERGQAKLAALGRNRRLHEELERAYRAIRHDLNQQLRPEISELASAFLTEITDARYGELELDDNYQLLVLEDGIPKPVISGGEEDLANLVFRLAISQMIAERAGQTFSLLILDEVFGSLDESRRHNVVDLLRGLRDRFEQVIVITHVESVREGLDSVISVRHDEETGAARVTVHEGGMALAEAPPLVGAGVGG